MAKKIGDAMILAVLLSFLIGGFTSFILWADFSTGIDSGIQADLQAISSNSSTEDLQAQTTTAFYETGTFVPQAYVEQDTRASEVIGIGDLFTHNILFALITEISTKLPIPAEVVGLVLALLTVTVMILSIRFFMGETKI